MSKPKKVVPKVPKVEPQFSLTLKLGNELYTSTGSTMLEALSNFPKPPKILLKGILTVKKGENVRTTILFPVKLKRLFWKVTRPFIAKRLAIGL